MTAFGNRALQAGVIRIAREEREELWLARKFRPIAIVIDNSLKTSNTTHRLCGSFPISRFRLCVLLPKISGLDDKTRGHLLDVIDVIKVDNPQIRGTRLPV